MYYYHIQRSDVFMSSLGYHFAHCISFLAFCFVLFCFLFALVFHLFPFPISPCFVSFHFFGCVHFSFPYLSGHTLWHYPLAEGSHSFAPERPLLYLLLGTKSYCPTSFLTITSYPRYAELFSTNLNAIHPSRTSSTFYHFLLISSSFVFLGIFAHVSYFHDYR